MANAASRSCCPLFRRVSALFAIAAVTLAAASTQASVRRQPKPREAVTFGVPVSETSWLVGGLARGQLFELSSSAELPLLERYLEPYRNYTPEWRAFFRGAFGPRLSLAELCWTGASCASPSAGDWHLVGPTRWELRGPALTPLTLEPELDLSALRAPEPEFVSVRRRQRCPRWKAPPEVTVLRYAGEAERLALTDCDGAVAADTVDRLSVLARPPGAARPELPLPSAPLGEAGEWTPEVKLLHPRLIWALSELARAFPHHALVFMSGYRRDGHSGLHGKGQALDLYVRGVENETVFAVCRALRDVGCGFYPNNHFVHIDVRAHGTGHVAWVDVSEPGQPSRYVDGWPGLLPAKGGDRDAPLNGE